MYQFVGGFKPFFVEFVIRIFFQHSLEFPVEYFCSVDISAITALKTWIMSSKSKRAKGNACWNESLHKAKKALHNQREDGKVVSTKHKASSTDASRAKWAWGQSTIVSLVKSKNLYMVGISANLLWPRPR